MKILGMPEGTDYWIYSAMLVLALFGILMITSATMGVSAGNYGGLLFTVIKQLVFTFLGYVAMFLCAKLFTFDRMRTNILFIVGATVVLLAACLAFGEVNGARAWIRISFGGSNDISFQPSELAKISVMCVIATYLCDISRTRRRRFELIQPVLIDIGIMVAIILFLQSDLGSAAIVVGISFFCFLIPQHPQLRKYQKTFLTIFLFLVGAFVFLMTPIGSSLVEALPISLYQKNRFLSAVNPFIDKYKSGYQLVNGLISFASGGFRGVGFGNSVRKYTNFPQSNSDYILAIVVEETGFLGFMAIVILYGIIIWRLFHYALQMKREAGKVFLIGTAMYIFIHFVLNVGGVTGLIPLTGVPLLMISAGGSSTMTIMMALGICQAIISQYHRGLIE